MRNTMIQPISDSKNDNENIKRLNKTITHQQWHIIQSLQMELQFAETQKSEQWKNYSKVML